MIYYKTPGYTGPNPRPVIMAELDFLDSPIYAHSGFGEIEFEGNTYLGVGQFGTISTMAAGAELDRGTIAATLSGIEPSGVPLSVINDPDQYQGRNAVISIAMLDENWNVTGPRAISFAGRMDVCSAEVGETATVSVTIEGYMSDWDRARVKLYTNEEQQRVYPGDKFFEFVPQMAEVELPWGIKST